MSYDFILKGDIAYSYSASEIVTCKDSYLVCKCGICQGVFDRIPSEYQDLPVIDHTSKPLTFEEGFYLATAGGGSYFGNVGSFKKGYECDLVILDDSRIRSPRELSIKERVERACYIDNDVHLTAKYVRGRKVI